MQREFRIHFATNRALAADPDGGIDDFTAGFSAVNPANFRVGEAVLRVDGDPAEDGAWRFVGYELEGEKLDALPGERVLGSSAMMDKLRLRMREEAADAMIYLHGFANTPLSALIRAAQLQLTYGRKKRPLRVIPFLWPSQGRLIWSAPYFDDRKAAEASGPAMGQALARFIDFMSRIAAEDRRIAREAALEDRPLDPEDLLSCGRRVHLMAHSMGNWALRHAFLAYQNRRGGGLPRAVDEAFLMCADEDRDALSLPQAGWPQKLHRLTELCERVHVYHAADDRALIASDYTKGNEARLGARGPDDWNRVSDRVFAVDCSDVSDTDFDDMRHQYYRARPEVIRDVRRTLAGKPLEGREGRAPGRFARACRLTPQE